jgi:hypothetical protein
VGDRLAKVNAHMEVSLEINHGSVASDFISNSQEDSLLRVNRGEGILQGGRNKCSEGIEELCRLGISESSGALVRCDKALRRASVKGHGETSQWCRWFLVERRC